MIFINLKKKLNKLILTSIINSNFYNNLSINLNFKKYLKNPSNHITLNYYKLNNQLKITINLATLITIIKIY
jgi:hypothetical protein